MAKELVEKEKERPSGRPDDDGSTAYRDDFLMRGQVAARLRVSIATVRRMQGRELHPERDEEGCYWFDPFEVEAVRLRRPPPPEAPTCSDAGDLAAEAFKLFRDGVDVRDVVIALKRPPDAVAGLHAQWARMGEAVLVSAEVLYQLRRMVAYELLPEVIHEAIEANDYEPIRDYVFEFIKDKVARLRRG